MKKLFKSKKRTLFTVIISVAVLILLVNTVAAAFYSIVIFKKDGWTGFEEYSYGEDTPVDYKWIEGKSQSVCTENSAGETLKGLEIKNEHISHSYVIICHRYGESPLDMSEYAQHFYELGFNIILPYLRGHGESEHGNGSLGWSESGDILAWIDSVVQKDRESRIVLFGVSMGANAVTLASAGELAENVRLTVSDSCYTSFEDVMKQYVKSETPFISSLVAGVMNMLCKSEISEGDTVVATKNIELPVLFINGENDSVVPPLVSKKLYESCNSAEVKEIIIPEGTHGRNLQADADTYWSNIDAFILNNLGI